MTPGRPKSSSRQMIEEAAAELFLEQSYAGTTIEDIAARAGVSRATFFNYFESKSDLLWIDADNAIEALERELNGEAGTREAILKIAESVGVERVPLSLTQAEAMGTSEEITASGLARVARLSAALTRAARREAPGAASSLERRVRANSITGALTAAWGAWALGGTSREPLRNYVEKALALVEIE